MEDDEAAQAFVGTWNQWNERRAHGIEMTPQRPIAPRTSASDPLDFLAEQTQWV